MHTKMTMPKLEQTTDDDCWVDLPPAEDSRSAEERATRTRSWTLNRLMRRRRRRRMDRPDPEHEAAVGHEAEPAALDPLTGCGHARADTASFAAGQSMANAGHRPPAPCLDPKTIGRG